MNEIYDTVRYVTTQGNTPVKLCDVARVKSNPHTEYPLVHIDYELVNIGY